MHNAMAELLGGTDAMAGTAQTSDVVVRVRTTARQGDYVVGDGRERQYAVGLAVTTQALGIEAALALGYTSTTAKATRSRLGASIKHGACLPICPSICPN